MRYILPLVFGFIVGSLPTTYLLVKWRKKFDIRNAGTGNVGTMNVYEVTDSTPLGLAVFAIDLAKSLAAVLLAGGLFGGEYWTMGVAGIGAMLGHNYSPWLGFKGGRGLVTGLGVSLVLGWVVGAAWLILFGATFLARRDIHTGNIAATTLMPVALALIPEGTMHALVPGWERGDIVSLSVCLGVIILLGHFSIISQFFKPSTTRQ